MFYIIFGANITTVYFKLEIVNDATVIERLSNTSCWFSSEI